MQLSIVASIRLEQEVILTALFHKLKTLDRVLIRTSVYALLQKSKLNNSAIRQKTSHIMLMSGVILPPPLSIPGDLATSFKPIFRQPTSIRCHHHSHRVNLQ